MSFGTLTEEQAKILYDRWTLEKAEGADLNNIANSGGFNCLHKACTLCGGTGVRKDGLGFCFHGIACPCPRCSITA